jgi:hypothetical protein
VLEAVFILLEFPSPSRRIFIGSHSLPPLWFAVSVLHSGAPCHVSFGFFFRFFGIFLPKHQMDPQPESTTQPKARGLLHMECDFAIALPYQFRLQDNTGIVEDLQEQHSRTLGTTRENFRIAQTSAGVHSSLRMLQLFLRTFDL